MDLTKIASRIASNKLFHVVVWDEISGEWSDWGMLPADDSNFAKTAIDLNKAICSAAEDVDFLDENNELPYRVTGCDRVPDLATVTPGSIDKNQLVVEQEQIANALQSGDQAPEFTQSYVSGPGYWAICRDDRDSLSVMLFQ